MSPAEKIWWTKTLFSVVLAWLLLALQLVFYLNGTTLFMVGVIAYLALSDVLSSRMGVEKTRGLKIGVGSYFLTWLTSWILLYTCFRPAI